MADLLAIENVTAGYRDTVVLESVSAAIGTRESWAVLGRNGVGKTTLLMTIMGLTAMRGGSIKFDDAEITSLSTHARARAGIGYVPQEREIFPSLTVDENLRVAAREGEWNRERVYDLFPRLAERQRNYGNQLSGGEQQMLAIARALMTNPRLLILDEATEGLAPRIRADIYRSIGELKAQGLSILVIDKDVRALTRVADRHYVLEKGRVVWTGSSNELAADTNVQHRYLGV
jgi:branched-chain amino acid transport system ATP-binding protein